MSSCLNLKKLIPHKKVWKLLTNKLHFKLIKSKPTKKPKPKHRSFKAPKKVCWPSLSIQPKKFKKHTNFNTIIHHKNHHCYLQRRPPPVFVDHLYVEPLSVVEEHVATSSYRKTSCKDSGDDERSLPESGKEEVSLIEGERSVSADDVWESMVMASPQMEEINERADEFIARFRAEMQKQEILARSL